MKKIARLAVLGGILSVLVFLIYVPAFPAQNIVVTGREAWLICAALAMPCPSNPQFTAYNAGYASATYILFRFGTGPQPHYPLKVTVYFTNVSTNVTTTVNVFLKDDHTACTDTEKQPSTCVS